MFEEKYHPYIVFGLRTKGRQGEARRQLASIVSYGIYTWHYSWYLIPGLVHPVADSQLAT